MFPDSTPEKFKNLLKIHPKNVPNGPGTEDDGDARGWEKELWNQELFVVEKLLDADPRNSSSRRRLVLESMPTPKPELSELAYTTKKIESNFLNFSQLDETQSKEKESELVHNAMYTDPNDQSLWIYHRWLVGTGDSRDVLEQEIAVIHGPMPEEETDSQWCMDLLLRKHASFCVPILEQLRARYDETDLVQM
ncbi:hypothetical protein EV361DRAFT_915800 [Lentinula raphanica]|nr:hypothetical protein EV361DRAFT_915800 [Lentinula raphanica]